MMYQINVTRPDKRVAGVVNSLTWKRQRGGRALVRAFQVVYGVERAAVRFDEKADAEMVSKALKKEFGLNSTVKAVEWGLT